MDPRVAQLDDPVDHLLLGFLDLPLLGAGLHQELQLLDREQPGLGPLAPAEQAHEDAADRRGQPDERREDAGDDRQGPRRDEREALGEVQGQGLGDQLADDDRGQRDEQGDQDEGDAVGRILERLPRDGAKHAGEGVAERHRADGRGQEAQERDHQADRGQEALRIVDQAARHLGAAVPLVGQLLEPMAAHGEQGDLRRREHATDQDQDQDQEQVEPRIPGAGAAFRHPEGLPRPVRPRGFGAARWAAPECQPPSCPAATSRVTTLPAPVLAPAPMVTGARSMVSTPMKAPSPMTVWCLFVPSKLAVTVPAPMFTSSPTSASPR